MTTRRRFLTLTTAAIAAPAISRGAFAQTAWPGAKPIRAICPFQAGSTVDILGRIISDPLGAAIGQTIVVENRGGAGGSTGSAAVATADPDGYTLLINAAAHTAAPAAYPNITYDPAKDFAGVAMIGVVPNVIVIAPSKGIKTARELVEKAKSGEMTYASAGVGSATHWGAERFRLSAGFKGTHVPFRGGPAALTEVATGRVDWMTIGTGSGLPLIQDNRLIPLAVTTQKRSAALPDVPTTLEARLQGFRLHILERLPRPGEDAQADHRSAAQRDHQDRRQCGRQAEARSARRRAAAVIACRIRRADAQGDHRQSRARQGGRTEIQLRAPRA